MYSSVSEVLVWTAVLCDPEHADAELSNAHQLKVLVCQTLSYYNHYYTLPVHEA
jgi:hypothetical protein